ncbi:MAG: sulfatase-like hydrolase/transferase [Candidatus Aminicenantes bacterium]|nr:sulfatase-like hydrolase/transferase [Candidatus Aminicenantes bacterium]
MSSDNRHSYKPTLVKLFSPALWGILLGFIIGFILSLISIINNRYIPQKMTRLIFSSLKENFNFYVIFFLVFIYSSYILWFLFLFLVKKNKDRATALTLIFLAVSGLSYYFIQHSRLSSLQRLRSVLFTKVNGLLQGKIKFMEFLNTSKKYIVLVLFLFLLIGFLYWIFMKTKIRWNKICNTPFLKTSIWRYVGIFLIIPIFLLNAADFIDSKSNAAKNYNIVWVLIDALRADHLGCYGYEKNTSPFMDQFASESMLFKSAFSQESYTMASVPSYFTSTYPLEHRVLYDHPDGIDVLHPKFLTLAEILKNNNYCSAAFVFNPHLKAEYHFDQGFDLYDDNKEGWNYSLPPNETFETAKKIHHKLKRYVKKKKNRPVFLYLHYRDIHAPYVPPPPYHKMFLPADIEPQVDILHETTLSPSRDNIDLWISQYDGEIRYTDDVLKQTFEMLESYGIDKNNSIIIFTSDHGEEFLDEHPDDPGGLYHGRTLYHEQIHVPLIMSIPGIKTERKTWDSYIELIDIFPTILDVTKIDKDQFSQIQGKSFLGLILNKEKKRYFAYSGGNYNRGVLIEKEWKYYFYEKKIKNGEMNQHRRPTDEVRYIYGEQLFNIIKDPGELKNVLRMHENIVSAMREKYTELISKHMTSQNAPKKQMDEETRKKLKALGYIK